MNKDQVRVRFAPSPTGELHLGNARTAIFNWLFARKMGGSFILRIEDTDQERSKPEYTQMILEDLRWLGLDWDEGPERGGPMGPYLQSQRLPIYREHAQRLKEKGHTYLCYCSQEELEARRKEAQEKGLPPRYDNRCRSLSQDEIRRFEAEGRKPVTRFKVEPELVRIKDLIRGEVEFDTSLFGDFVIFKSDGFPTFHFAVAVDDGLMGVTHVIRGEDHLSNTPRHVLLFRALGFEVPQFAHLSMIMGPDGTRLSKRHGATSVGFYRSEGFLSDALLNYLALLGWSSGDDQEIFSQSELKEKFSIERVVGSAAIFNPEKLHWVGEQHIRRVSLQELSEKLGVFSPGLLDRASIDRLSGWIGFMRERAGTLKELLNELQIFLEAPNLDTEEAQKALSIPDAHRTLQAISSLLEKEWTEDAFPVKSLTNCQKSLGIGGAQFYPLLRIAITGHPHGPELKELCPRLGKSIVLERLERARNAIKNL